MEPVLDPGPSSGDTLGVYPAERDVSALEGRRHLWTARAFAMGMFFSLLLNVVLGFAISSLAPLKSVEPMLVTFKERSDQIVKIEPFTRGTTGFELMTETMVRDYVLYREEIAVDEAEMRRRWGGEGVIAHRSDPEEYQRFVAGMLGKYDDLRQKRISRTVNIRSVSKIADGYWQVEFSTTDFDALNKKISENNWVASMTVGYVSREVTWDDRYMNPLGFTVNAYSVSAKQ
jgi:type IV secretion system protein VirB8